MTEDLIPSPSQIQNSVLDPQVNVSLIEKYCDQQAFNKILHVVETKKKRTNWKCGTCLKSLRNSRSIACEKCLLWSHFNCAEIQQKPSGDWFCRGCADSLKNSKFSTFVFQFCQFFSNVYIYVSSRRKDLQTISHSFTFFFLL